MSKKDKKKKKSKKEYTDTNKKKKSKKKDNKKSKKSKIQNRIAEDAAELKNVKADSNLGFETADAKAQQNKQAENEKDEQERDALVKAAAAQFNK